VLGLEPNDSATAPTPEEARARSGLRSPREQYAEQLAARTVVPDAGPRDAESDLLAFG